MYIYIYTHVFIFYGLKVSVQFSGRCSRWACATFSFAFFHWVQNFHSLAVGNDHIFFYVFSVIKLRKMYV